MVLVACLAAKAASVIGATMTSTLSATSVELALGISVFDDAVYKHSEGYHIEPWPYLNWITLMSTNAIAFGVGAVRTASGLGCENAEAGSLSGLGCSATTLREVCEQYFSDFVHNAT